MYVGTIKDPTDFICLWLWIITTYAFGNKENKPQQTNSKQERATTNYIHGKAPIKISVNSANSTHYSEDSTHYSEDSTLYTKQCSE